MDEPQTQKDAEAPPPFLLSKDEQRVLALYDELRDLEIKVALIKAQQNYTPGNQRLTFLTFENYSDSLSRVICTDHRRECAKGAGRRRKGAGRVATEERHHRQRHDRQPDPQGRTRQHASHAR